ncbi:lasso peptide biosynthesis PqqD family chaperone [Streptomyces sp. LX-29]|uniref:lasso peptide biosynthesis PqqD family chaperone n=1 Tax=Streptomyces sp. LX-29 TaxID=2900152 RepID=UPI00240D1283|nr:lasso peptide biosynthesis PqqD family chaperone [Streptomyces sp. LX-29]WFB05935.1 lasso peptide biosynthesis PqqD family chaperone [Streptomyces sp. LX-29]
MSRLRADVSHTPTEDGAVLLDQRSGKYWRLNATGAAVVQALIDGATAEQIVDRLVEARPVGRERAAADVAALVDQLTKARLVTP